MRPPTLAFLTTLVLSRSWPIGFAIRNWRISRTAHTSTSGPSAKISGLKVLERCGHLPMVEKPETFHRLLYDFLVGTEEELPDVVQV
jgi:pimeloyl-ACP methyl ester carboxylesterase